MNINLSRTLNICNCVLFLYALRALFQIPNNVWPDKTLSVATGTKSTNAIKYSCFHMFNITEPRRPCSWTYKINKEAESRIWQETMPNAKQRSNSTRKHTKIQGKTWNSTHRNKAHGRRKLCHSPCVILPLKNFSGAKLVSMNSPKFSIATALWRNSLLNAKKISDLNKCHKIHVPMN